MKENGFVEKPHGFKGCTASTTKMTGFTTILDGLLQAGVTNSKVCMKRLQQEGFPGGLYTVKEYISTHQHLVTAKQHLVAPQGNRGQRYSTEPGEAFQMDWGITKVRDHERTEYAVACFAMVFPPLRPAVSGAAILHHSEGLHNLGEGFWSGNWRIGSKNPLSLS